MYCLWVTLAEKDDNFVIETTKPLPKKYNNMSEKEQIKFIKERILGRPNEELVKVRVSQDTYFFLQSQVMIIVWQANMGV